jgi:hypothetical protein
VLEKVCQLEVVIGAVLWMRRRGWTCRQAGPELIGPPWQFSLKQLLIWITLCALLLRLARVPLIDVEHEDGSWQITLDEERSGVTLIVSGGEIFEGSWWSIILFPYCAMFLPAVLLVALWLLLGQRRLLPSSIAFAACVIALAGIAFLSWPARSMENLWLQLRLHPWPFWLPGAQWQVATIFVTLVTVRLAGYRLVRRERIEQDSAA